MGMSKSNKSYKTTKHGRYGSYGKSDLITFQSKVDRRLYEKFDAVRTITRRTRRECLEDFFQYVIDHYDGSSGVFRFVEDA
tara:strand:+ start:151 stop:393 length:243 start_codon:yes stop_codon:yes gene_type:complete